MENEYEDINKSFTRVESLRSTITANGYYPNAIEDQENNITNNLKDDFLNKFERKSTSDSIKQYYKNEKLGILYVLMAHFCWGTNSVYLKWVQRRYSEYFRTIPFLFFRGIMILTIATCVSFYKNEHILRWHEIDLKFCFFIRTNLNFFSVALFVVGVWYLRVSTSQIISTLNPIFLIILSALILKEKFHFRYIIGTAICLLGAFIIILNERKVNSSSGSKTEKLDQNEKPFFSTGTLIGITCSFINVLFGSFISITNKILAKNKIPVTSQLFYVGLSTLFYSFIYILFEGCPYCFGYIIGSMGHSFGFYCGNVLFNMGIKIVDLSKSAAVSYMKLVFVFIFGAIFLKEPIFLTDIIGSLLIVSYMLYNITYPILDYKK